MRLCANWSIEGEKIMNEDDRLCKTCAAGAPGCSQWKPIIPLPDAVADSEDANKAILRDAPAASDTFLLDDPGAIQGRLAAAN
jgi:hypothetical protein